MWNRGVCSEMSPRPSPMRIEWTFSCTVASSFHTDLGMAESKASVPLGRDSRRDLRGACSVSGDAEWDGRRRTSTSGARGRAGLCQRARTGPQPGSPELTIYGCCRATTCACISIGRRDCFRHAVDHFRRDDGAAAWERFDLTARGRTTRWCWCRCWCFGWLEEPARVGRRFPTWPPARRVQL